MNLTVRVRHALRDFTLDVAFEAPPGFTVLFGPSGAGKSRTLAFVAGLARPDAASRIALGDDVWFDSATRRERPIHLRRVAFVFQSLALFPHMTALDNVAYGIAGARDERRARAQEMLSRMRVAHLSDRKPRTFSGGESQRVALARAFAIEPRVLLLDEPFSALDAGVKRELLAEIKEHVARAQVPAILVTHDVAEARALGERVLFIEKGRIERTSSIDDAALSAPKLRSAEPSA